MLDRGGYLSRELRYKDKFRPLGRMLGNVPQAFSHAALVNTALNRTQRAGPAEHRGGGTTTSPTAADTT